MRKLSSGAVFHHGHMPSEWQSKDLNSDLPPPVLVQRSVKQLKKCCRPPSSLSLSGDRASIFPAHMQTLVLTGKQLIKGSPQWI